MASRTGQGEMQAWLSGAEPGMANLARVSLATPVPGDDELLVRVEAAALNFSDMLMIDGAYQVRPPRPFVPGQEVAGTVVAAGPGASIEPGRRVAGKVLWGGFADFARLRTDMAISVPGPMSLVDAVALPVVYTTAVVALTEATEVAPGETVLIHAAAGGVGLAAVQLARALGARVIATAGSAEKCAVALEHGAERAINYREEDWMSEIRGLPGGGADVVVDPVGGEIGEASLRCLAYRGRYLVVGFASGAVPALSANRLLLKRASAIGIYWDHDRDAEMLARATARMVALCERGDLRPVVGRVYPFEHLPRALADLRDRNSVGKLVLAVAGTEGAAS